MCRCVCIVLRQASNPFRTRCPWSRLEDTRSWTPHKLSLEYCKPRTWLGLWYNEVTGGSTDSRKSRLRQTDGKETKGNQRAKEKILTVTSALRLKEHSLSDKADNLNQRLGLLNLGRYRRESIRVAGLALTRRPPRRLQAKFRSGLLHSIHTPSEYEYGRVSSIRCLVGSQCSQEDTLLCCASRSPRTVLPQGYEELPASKSNTYSHSSPFSCFQ